MPVKLTDLQLIYGVAGARENFEDLTAHLIRSERPDAQRIRIARGDGGIDAYDGPLDSSAGVDVFQIKFFPLGIGDSQRDQIRASLRSVRDSTQFIAKSWTLCVPVNLSIGEKEWFDQWKIKEEAIDIRPVWDAFHLESLLYEHKNTAIREQFFKEEHLKQIREMHQTLGKLAQDFEERIPVPVPLILRPHLEEVRSRRSYAHDDPSFVVVEVELGFSVENVSPQSASNWTVNCSISGPRDAILNKKDFPKLGSGNGYYRLNTTILPTQSMTTEILFGLKLSKSEPLEAEVRRVLSRAEVTFWAISDNHVGERTTLPVADIIQWDSVINGMQESLQKEKLS